MRGPANDSNEAELLGEMRRGMAFRLKEIRKERGLGRKDVSALCGIDSDTLRRVECLGTSINTQTLFLLCGGLEISADWLMWGERLPFGSKR